MAKFKVVLKADPEDEDLRTHIEDGLEDEGYRLVSFEPAEGKGIREVVVVVEEAETSLPLQDLFGGMMLVGESVVSVEEVGAGD